MQWKIITVGKPALRWAREGLEDYLHRMSRTHSVECVPIKDGPPEIICKKMLELSIDSHRVLLDERGRHWRSKELAQWIGNQELHGCKRVSILIGGSSGHPEELKKVVKDSWSLSSMTLQHELALVVLVEQIYRAYSILRGDPYHRE